MILDTCKISFQECLRKRPKERRIALMMVGQQESGRFLSYSRCKDCIYDPRCFLTDVKTIALLTLLNLKVILPATCL